MKGLMIISTKTHLIMQISSISYNRIINNSLIDKDKLSISNYTEF